MGTASQYSFLSEPAKGHSRCRATIQTLALPGYSTVDRLCGYKEGITNILYHAPLCRSFPFLHTDKAHNLSIHSWSLFLEVTLYLKRPSSNADPPPQYHSSETTLPRAYSLPSHQTYFSKEKSSYFLVPSCKMLLKYLSYCSVNKGSQLSENNTFSTEHIYSYTQPCGLSFFSWQEIKISCHRLGA